MFAGPAGERDDGIAVAAGRHRVFVGGFAAHVPGVSQWAVHAYRASTGELLWSDYRDGGQVAAITARGDGVIAAGQQGDRAVVRAYDAATGILRWDDVLGQNSIAAAVDTDHRFAYWGGQTETSTGGNPAFIVRAVDLETGAIAWQDVGPQAGGRFTDLAVTAQRVVAVGHTTAGPGVPQSGSVGDFLVRAYSTR